MSSATLLFRGRNCYIMLTNKRLLKIIENFPKCTVAADIGCDHGKLAVELIKRDLAQKVIASDISESSLSKAKKAARELDLDDKIECVLADGLDSIKGKGVESVVIAGMGGMLIADIINGGKEFISGCSFCLCPHTNEAHLRKYLSENGLCVYKETVIKEDGKFYQLIFAKHGKCTALSQEDLEYGNKEYLEINDDYFEFLDYRITCLEKELSAMKNGGASDCDIAHKEALLEMAKRRAQWR